MRQVKKVFEEKFAGVMGTYWVAIGKNATQYIELVIRQACEAENREDRSKACIEYVGKDFVIFSLPNFGRVRRRIKYRLERQTHHQIWLVTLNPLSKKIHCTKLNDAQKNEKEVGLWRG